MHIHIIHRAIRLNDNTSLIHQLKEISNKETVQIIFIFTPEQINKNKNKYFSDASVQFMIESLHELSDTIAKHKGKLLFFKGDNIKVLNKIHKTTKIKTLSFNYEYTPYGKERSNNIHEWATKNDIIVYEKEDYALYDILTGDTLKEDKTPYLVYTPYMKHVSKLKVREVDNYITNKIEFDYSKKLENINYNIKEQDIDKFYINNDNINVHGGRSNSLKILKHIDDFKDYQKGRDYLMYKTTFLGATNHFGTCSIREVYNAIVDKLGKNSGLVRELIFRQFYMEICYHYPHVLQGQIKGKNKSFKLKYDNIKWSYNKNHYKRWCDGTTGYLIVDACMRQLNTINYMVNRGRMITTSFAIRNLHLDWRDTEKYFATKLVDYDPINNSQGHQWVAGCGTDAQPWFRIFNPITQLINWDYNCEFIYKWIPEVKSVPIKDLHNWFDPKIHNKWLEKGIKYYAPIVDHSIERENSIKIYKKALS
jgi:deoxyribodipyrimidine photo-lyase